ncbi:MAG: polysulfide reductase NrfD [Deltaproteobacteria bacterium]|nr:polysulfide reductase NrfD [Deltaproteobacteria bacterium]
MNSAVVTLDVLHSGVIWGWYVTMNFWAKSIATGVILLAPWLLKRSENPQLRFLTAGVGFVFLNITLLFTVLDLHQPFRFWHMFVHPHFTSVINIGAWILTALNGLLVLHLFMAWRKRDALYDKLLPVTWFVAFLATIYTAGLLGQANAREIWQAPAEVAQMILAATLSGSAVFLLIGGGDAEIKRHLGTVLGVSALVALSIFLAEIFLAPQKSEEAEYLIHILVSGQLSGLFLGGLVVGFVAPAVLAYVGVRKNQAGLLALASVMGLVGLWLVKHAWLIAPQLIPLS